MDSAVMSLISAIAVALIGGGTTIFNVVYTNRKNAKKRANDYDEALRNGVQCLLRADIIHVHDKYTKLKYCPIYVKEALTRGYKAYHALNGNDVATDLYNDVMKLSETPPETE